MGLFFLQQKIQKKKKQTKTPSVLFSPTMSDIFFDSKKRFISLQQKYWVIHKKYFSLRVSKEPFQFLSERKEVLRRCAIFLLVIFFLGFFSPFTSANVSTFYPTTCLGGWDHPENATGAPSLDKKSSAEEYTLGNSARLKETTSPLFCGGFKGAIPQNTKPTTFKVSFSWTVDDGSVVHNEVRPAESTSTVDTPSSGIPAEANQPSEEAITTSNTSSTPEVIEIPPTPEVETPVSAQESAPTTSPSSESGGESVSPLSFLRGLLPSVVFAQEAESSVTTPEPAPASEPVVISDTPSEVISPVSESLPTTEQMIDLTAPVITSTPSTTQETAVTPLSISEGTSSSQDVPTTSLPSPEITPSTDVPLDAFLEVDYTLDGTQWSKLGIVARSSWKTASFDIPLKAWENLDRLQISLKSLPTFDQSPVVYLDSMALTVEYDDIKDELVPPIVILKDESSLISGKTDFTPSDEVEFSIASPSLDVQDLKKLVSDGTAEVVEDKSGVLDEAVVDLDIQQVQAQPVESIQEIFQPVIDQIQESTVVPEIVPPGPVPIPLTTTSNNSPLEIIQVAHPEIEVPVLVPEKKIEIPQPISIDPSPLSVAPLVNIAHADETDIPDITAVVLDVNGEETTISANIVTVLVGGIEKQQIHIGRPEREFKPGRYTLKVTLNTASAILVSEQDFTWGVLAINTDKAVYHTGDDAYLQMGVLNDSGHTLCHADLDLQVKTPSGITSHFTTDDGSIVRDEQCGPDNVIDVPDYYTHYSIPTEVGEYEMTLTAVTANGTKKIIDHFTVGNSPLFDVRRKGPTRIYPVANYPVSLFITSPVNWSGTITEKVPVSFGISQPVHSLAYDTVETQGDEKIISWNVDLEAGKKVTLGYVFDAPNISPEFYLLGPLEFQTSSGGTSVFSESRNWQIASDAACNATSTGTWGGTDTANFTNCTGAASGGSGTGNRPGAGDVLTIDAGVTVTVAANVSVGDIVIADPTTANGISINTGVTLTVTTSSGGGGSITYTANTQANAQTITMNGTGGVTAVSLTIPAPTSTGASNFTCAASATGTASFSGAVSITGNSTTTGGVTMGMLTCTLSVSGLTTVTGGTNGTGVASITSSTGTLTFAGGLTFAGTAANAQLTTTGASAIVNVTGTISAGGTISLTGTTITKFTGTSAINGAYTFTVVQVNSGTTTLGAAITFSSTLTVANGATLTLGDFAFTQTGTLTVGSGTSGTINVGGAGSTGTYTFSANVTVNAGGVFDLSAGTHAKSWGSSTISHSGATFNTGTGSETLTGTGVMTISGSSAMTFGGTLTVPTNKTWTNSNTSTVTLGALTMGVPTSANAVSLTTGSTTSVTGAITYTQNTTANAQTITMNGTANISAGSLTIPAPTSTGASNFTCAASATGTFTVGTVSITGNSTTTGAVTVGMLTCTLSASGLVTITGGTNATGAASLTSSTGTLTTSAGITFAGTAANAKLTTTGAGIHNFTGTMSSGGTVSYNGSTSFRLTGTCTLNGAYSFPAVQVNSGTTTLGVASIVFGGSTTIASGAILQLGNFAWTMNNSLSITGTLNGGTGSTGTYAFASAITVNSGGVFDLTQGTHAKTYGGASYVMNGTTWNTGTGADTFQFGGANSLTGSAAMTFGGTVTIPSAQTMTNNKTSGTVTMGALTIASAASANGFTGATGSTTSITGAITYTANAGANAQTITMGGTANITAGSLVINAPTSTGASNFTGSSASGTFTVGTIAITGNSTSTGAVTITVAGYTLIATSTVTITGGTNGTGVATINGSTGGTVTVQSGVTFAGTAANARFNTGGTATVNITGTLGSGGTVTQASNTVATNFSGTSAINGAYTLRAVNVNSGTLTLGAGTITFNTGQSGAAGTTIANGAVLSLGNFAWNCTAPLTIGSGTSGTLSVAGAGNTGSYVFASTVTVNAGGILNLSNGTHATSVSGGQTWTHNGATWNFGTGAFSMSSSALILAGGSAMTFGGTTTINAGGNMTNNNTNTVTMAALTFASASTSDSYTAGTGSTTSITGAITYNANSGGNAQSITMNGTANLSAASLTMNAQTGTNGSQSIIQAAVSASGTISISGATTITGSASSSNFSRIDLATTANTVNYTTGSLSIVGGAASPAQMTMSSGTLTVNGNLSFSGTAANAQLTGGAGAIVLNNCTMSSGGTVSIASATVSTSGTTALNGGYTLPTLSVTGGTTTTGATTTVTGALSVSNGAVLSLGNFAFTASSTTTIGSGVSGTISVAGAGSTGTYTFSNNITVNSGGTFNLSAGTHATTFTGTMSHSGSTWNTGTGATTFGGTAAFDGSSSMTFGGTMTIASGQTITNNNTSNVTIASLTIASPTSANNLSLTTGSTTTVTGALTFTANATANAQTITINGTAGLVVGSLTIPAPTSTGASNITCAASATGYLNVTGAVAITGNSTSTGAVTLGLLTCAATFASTTTITGGTNATGAASITSSTGTLAFNGGLTFAGTAANAKLTTTGAGNIYVKGTISSGGTLSINSSTTTHFSGTGGSGCAINGAYTFGNVAIDGDAMTVENTTLTLGAGTITFAGALDVQSANALQLGNFAFTQTGAVNIYTGLYGAGAIYGGSGSTGTYTFSGDITLDVNGTFDLSINSGTHAKSWGGTTITNNMGPLGTFNTGTGTETITGTGTITLAGDSNMIFGGAMTIPTGKTLVNSNTGSISLNSTVTISSGNTGMTLNDLSTTTIAGAFSFQANSSAGTAQLVTLNGSAYLGADSITMPATTSTGTAKITCGSGATGMLQVTNGTSITGSSTASGGTSSIDFGTVASACVFYAGGGLTLAGGSTGTAALIVDTGNVDIYGNITFGTAGNVSRSVMTIGATSAFNIGTGSFGANGTVSIDSGAVTNILDAESIDGSYTLPSVTVIGGDLTINNTVTISTGLTVNSGFQIILGGYAFTSTGETTIFGTMTCPTAATCTGLKRFGGQLIIGAGGLVDFTNPSVAPALQFEGGIDANISASASINFGTGATAFASVDQSLTGDQFMRFGGPVTINNGLTLTNANTRRLTFDSTVTGGDSFSDFATELNSVTLFKNTAMTTGTLTPSTSYNTVEYGSTSSTIKPASTNPYYNLSITSSTRTLAANLVVTDTLLVSAAALDTTGSNYSVTTNDLTITGGSTLTANGSTITVTDDWSNSGTFTAGTSTVIFNGGTAATISGTTDFYNLTITHSSAKDVFFQSSGSPVFTVTNVFSAVGHAGQRVKLYSDSNGTQWHFHPTGIASVDYVDTRDSACESGSVQVTRTNWTDVGNNGTCWSDATLTFDISDTSIGFGTLTTANARWATGDTLGSASDTSAHTMTLSTTASGGYVLSYIGALPTSGSNTIAAASITNDADGTPGSEAFGLGISTSGSSTIATGYDHNATAGLRDWSWVPNISTPIISSAGPVSTPEVISTYFLGNISSTTASGSYSTDVTYLLTGTF